MQSILSVLARSPFNFEITLEDAAIFDKIYQGYKQHRVSDELSMLFANITFILINRPVVDYLLSRLEADVRALWEEEHDLHGISLTLHKPRQFVELLGLTWPLPTAELASNRSHHLLSRVLLQGEQSHGLNTDNDRGAPVPTLFGFVENNLVNEIIKKGQLWNDETKLSGLMFHGKMLHRVQLNLLMKAMDLNLLNTDGLTIHELIEIFTTTRTSYHHTLAWDLLFDNFDINVLTNPQFVNENDPVSIALADKYQHQIKEGKADGRYLYNVDPYFFHSYLMTHSRNNTPYLSECVTQSFSKAALDIQQMEIEIGEMIENGERCFSERERLRMQKVRKLNPDELSMEHVLKRQEKYILSLGAHIINEKLVKDFMIREGKTARIVKSTGNIQYRSLFTRPNILSRNNGLNQGEEKRAKL